MIIPRISFSPSALWLRNKRLELEFDGEGRILVKKRDGFFDTDPAPPPAPPPPPPPPPQPFSTHSQSSSPLGTGAPPAYSPVSKAGTGSSGFFGGPPGPPPPPPGGPGGPPPGSNGPCISPGSTVTYTDQNGTVHN